MKPITYIISAALVAGTLGMSAKSPKRGLSENQFQFKAQLEAVAPGVSWYYNWGPSVGRYLANETQMEFVPMCWNDNYDADAIRTYVADHPEVKYLLGFNEPNFTNQANMTPAAAAAKWSDVMALAKELNLKLVAPALNYSPNPPYQSPTQWMDEFVALVGNDAFDYLAVHSYGGFGVMKELATTFHDRYGKDVWVTEFCLWPNEGDPNSYVAPDSQIASMIQSVEWLEKTDWIFRYAWFKAIGDSSSDKGPNYGLLISGKGETPRELSEQGKVYINLPDFNPEVYNPVNTLISSNNFISQNGILLGSNNDTVIDSPIEITRFNAGAWADYQFDVTEGGEYNLTLRVSGQGEPVRFDPTIGVFSVSGNEEEAELSPAQKLTLPGDNETYVEVTYPMTLAAGNLTLRIKDTTSSNPSGIRISSLKLSAVGGSGVNDIDAGNSDKPVDVYSVQGHLLRRGVSLSNALEDLPRGIYIVDGKKILK